MNRFHVIFIVLLFSIVIASLLCVIGHLDVWAAVFVLFLLVALPWARAFACKNRIDIFEPVYLLGVTYFMYFGFRTVWILLGGTVFSSMKSYIPVPSPSDLLWPQIVADVAFLAFLLGYYSPFSRILASSIPTRRCRWTGRGEFLGVILLLSIGTLFTVLNIIRGRLYGSVPLTELGVNLRFQFLVDTLAGLIKMGVVLAAVYQFEIKDNRPRSWFTFSLLVLSIVGMSVVVGSKQEIVYSLLFVLVPYYYLRGGLRLSQVGVGVSVCLFSFPFVATYYEVLHAASRTSFKLAYVIQDLTNVFKQLGRLGATGQLIPYTIDYLTNRLNGIDTLALIVNSNAHYSAKDFPSLVKIPLYLIPRFLWAEKPIMNFQSWFAKEFVGVQHYILIPTTQVGELYLNLGFWGVLLGMMISGVAMRSIYLYLFRRGITPANTFIYTCLLPLIWVSVEAPIANNVIGLFMRSVVLLCVVSVVDRLSAAKPQEGRRQSGNVGVDS